MLEMYYKFRKITRLVGIKKIISAFCGGWIGF
jgi:hypothetical protein